MMTRQQRRKLERQALKAGSASKWQPLTELDRDGLELSGNFSGAAKALGVQEEEALALAADYYSGSRFFVNDTYEVTMREAEQLGWVHLAIRRRDGRVVGDWSDKQRIKDQLVGPECEGIEIYPAQSRMLDIANVYHLWCNPNPDFRLGIGFECTRQVS